MSDCSLESREQWSGLRELLWKVKLFQTPKVRLAFKSIRPNVSDALVQSLDWHRCRCKWHSSQSSSAMRINWNVLLGNLRKGRLESYEAVRALIRSVHQREAPAIVIYDRQEAMSGRQLIRMSRMSRTSSRRTAFRSLHDKLCSCPEANGLAGSTEMTQKSNFKK